MSTASARLACVVRSLAGAIALTLLAVPVLRAQPAGANRIDTISPMAPELAPYGPHPIGVRTLSVTDPKRADVRNTPKGGPTAFAPRTLTLEAWYPAMSSAGAAKGGTYAALVRDGRTTVTLHGRAVRDAAPAAGSYPLVIISHGHPGSRYLLSHLAENLASKGYVVVAIDHADSLYAPEPLFASTLYNRPFDQLFVLNEVARLAMPRSGSFLAGHVDVSRTGIVGYSMGGYGVVNVVGGVFAEGVIDGSDAPPNRLLAERAASNPAFRSTLDPRIKAVIAIGPWGMQRGYWDLEGLKGITTPILFVAGSADDVSGYEKGTRAIFEGAVNADRYLLTFADANHNAAAPYPAPVESIAGPAAAAFSHHADPVWDTVRMNNILQHFATAYFGRHLLGDASQQAYFDLTPNGRDAVWAVDREGRPQAGHTYWKGFKRGTARGLSLEHRQPAAAQSAGTGSQETVEARVERLAGMQGEAAGAFYDRIRRALGMNDKAAACALVAFPLAHPAGAVQDAAACEARYDDIFTMAVRRAVGRQQWKDIFASDDGVAFGAGELWFAPRCAQRPCGAADLRITAINGAGGLRPPNGKELIACRLPEQAVSVVADGAGGASLRVWASDTRAGAPVVELLRGTPTAEATGQCAWRAWLFAGEPASYTVAEVACMPTVVPAPFGTVARVTRTTAGALPDSAWCYE